MPSRARLVAARFEFAAVTCNQLSRTVSPYRHGAFVEHRGRNRSQRNQRTTAAVVSERAISPATSCHRLRQRTHGKEGVNGSSPLEGSFESPAKRGFLAARLLSRPDNVMQVQPALALLGDIAAPATDAVSRARRGRARGRHRSRHDSQREDRGSCLAPGRRTMMIDRSRRFEAPAEGNGERDRAPFRRPD